MIRVRELREMKGIQQKELAIDLGVSQPTISDWESGRKIPSAKSAQKLADYFGVSTDYLLGRISTDPFSVRFRERVSAELSNVDYEDLKAAVENGFPYDEVLASVDECYPLSLAEACNIAMNMGRSVTELLGEEEDDYYTSTFGTLPPGWIINAKKSPSPDNSEPRDDTEKEINHLIRKMDYAQQSLLLAILKTIDAQNPQKFVAAQASGDDKSQ